MHAHTHMHAYTRAHWNGPGGFKRKGGKCCRGNSCTYFLCFVTIVINVQAITHSHRRTSTAALEDLAISINVLCPSVAVSSFPLKKKKIFPRRDTVSALLTAELSVSVALWKMETMGLFFFLCCLVLCVNRPYVFPLCTLGVFLCSFFYFFFIIFLNVGYIQDCLFPRRGKNKFKSRLSPPRGSFSLSWIMATITEDIGLGGACFIKLRVLGRMQNKLVEWESRCVCVWWITF